MYYGLLNILSVSACLNGTVTSWFDSGIAILAVETNQGTSAERAKCERRSSDGLERRSQFTPIVAIPPACVAANPLTGMHLKGCGSCAYHFPSLAPCIARRNFLLVSSLRIPGALVVFESVTPRRPTWQLPRKPGLTSFSLSSSQLHYKRCMIKTFYLLINTK
jgi:hypothetical protein